MLCFVTRTGLHTVTADLDEDNIQTKEFASYRDIYKPGSGLASYSKPGSAARTPRDTLRKPRPNGPRHRSRWFYFAELGARPLYLRNTAIITLPIPPQQQSSEARCFVERIPRELARLLPL